MTDDHEDEEGVPVKLDLDAEIVAHYEQRARAAGRTLEEQIRYELEGDHGYNLPDPSDTEAIQRGQLFRRINQRRILHG